MKLNYKSLLLGVLVAAGCSTPEIKQEITLVDRPDTSTKNEFYPSNRAPLQRNALIKLPVGDVKPEGWVLEYLNRQKNGLTGNLGKISAWLQKENNAWLSKDGQGAWGWEEVPYWLKGYGDIAYILEDPEMIEETKIWIEGALASQRENGYFGPGFAWESYIAENERTEERQQQMTQVQDYWANMIMLYCLQSYYEYSQDERVIELMTNYFKFELTVPDSLFLSETKYWQTRRGGDNLYSVIWLYNRTGDEFLLELADKIHRNTTDWSSRGNAFDDIHGHKESRNGEFPEWFGDLIDWHNVNIAQGFREPAQYYQVSGNKADLEGTYESFDVIRKYYGQVPGGMFGSDENARPGYDDPRQGIETCGIVEQMNSDEHLLRITGDIFWADHAENVAFNTYPAAVTDDFKALRYITSPNMVLNDSENHHPGIANAGPFLMMNPFSSRCCQHNHAQGWPYYAENLWMATQDNGLAAVLYAASNVTAKVGSGAEVSIHETTHYPFEETIQFEVSLSEDKTFPLYLRIPEWTMGPGVKINGKPVVDVSIERNKYVRINREWKDGDKVELTLPKAITVTRWEANHNSASVNYGPLTFSLDIDERYVRKESDETAIHDSKWQEGADTKNWPSFEIYADSPWNYGLVLNGEMGEVFEMIEKPWPANDFPFGADVVPLEIKVKAKQIPNWKIGPHGLVGELQDSPVITDTETVEVTLIPMGAAKLRISSFPVISTDGNGTQWTE